MLLLARCTSIAQLTRVATQRILVPSVRLHHPFAMTQRPRRSSQTAVATPAVVAVKANGRHRKTSGARAVHTEASAADSHEEDVKSIVVEVPAKRARMSKVKAEPAAVVETDKVAAPVKRSRAKKAVKAEDGEDVKAPVKRRRSSTKKVASYAESEDGGAQDDEAFDAAASVSADEDVKPKKPKAKRAKKPKEPIVYVIPDVEHRDFRLEGPIERRAERSGGYRGRLGYACLNTVLRNEDPPKFCSRNVRIKTIEEKGAEGLAYVKELALQNVRDLIPLLEFNAANNIRMMRLSSEIFPFASHEVYGYDIGFAAKELAEAGAVAKRLDQRLTMHPGQFCQLGTPKKTVLEASLRELDVHAKVLDLLGVGPEGVMILHGGGTFDDRQATLDRIRHTIENRLSPSVRSRLVLENDEYGYSAEELLPLCESLEPPVPLVFDFHHDMLRPSSLSPAEIIARAQALFARRGVPPKYHLSEPRPGAMTTVARRAHSDRCAELPPDLPADADLMLECKDKEQGVLEMFRVYRLHDVRHDVLRPPANDLTMATSGRRSKLDGQGGATHSKQARRKKGAARSDSASSSLSEESSEEEKKPVKKVRVTDHSLMERAIAKAKLVAEQRGIPYAGPRSQAEIDEGKAGLASGIEVKRDMEQKAEWVRAELRAGRERRSFPGAEEAEGAMDASQSQGQPEPEAY